MATRLLLLWLVVLCCAADVYGQQGAKAAVIGSRLLSSFAGRSDGGTITALDSNSYAYSGGRGGDIKTAWLNCDSVLHYSLQAPAFLSSKTRNHFNTANQLDTQVHHSRLVASQALDPSIRVMFSYDAMGREVLSIQQRWVNNAWVNEKRIDRYYKVSGLDSVTFEDSWSTGTGSWAQAPVRTVYSYHISGRLSQRLNEHWDGGAGTWMPTQRLVINRDAAGRALDSFIEFNSGGWVSYDHHYFHYSGSKLSATTHYVALITGPLPFQFAPYDSIHISNTGGAAPVEIALQYRWETSWKQMSRSTTQQNAIGAPLSTVNERWEDATASWENKSRRFWFYNGYDQLTREYSEQWLGSNWGLGNGTDWELRHHYEQYTTGVSTQLQALEGMILSPVPTGEVLTVALSFGSRTDFSAMVSDVTGRTVMSWSDAGMGLYTKDIDVRSWAPGRYWICINAGDTKTTKSFEVLR